MRAKKNQSKTWRKNVGRVIRTANGGKTITSKGGTEFSLGDSWDGKVSDRGVPVVYGDKHSRKSSEKGFQHLVRYIEALKNWDKGGRQVNRPYRYEYSMRPKGIGSNSIDRDMKLVPMSEVRAPEGRKPELIMRASDKMKTGQEPDYYKVWDEKRNQWSTRPVETEELDRYRQENRVFRTPSIRF